MILIGNSATLSRVYFQPALVIRSLVDQNSDVYIFEVFAPHIRQQIEDQKEHVQWTDLMCAPFLHRNSATDELCGWYLQRPIIESSTFGGCHQGEYRGIAQRPPLRMFDKSSTASLDGSPSNGLASLASCHDPHSQKPQGIARNSSHSYLFIRRESGIHRHHP